MAFSDEDLIKAALMDDPEDQEEEKSTDKKEVAGTDEADKTDDKEVETPNADDKDGETDEDADESKPDKPEQTEEEANESAKLTRKEKREERRKNFIESVKTENDQKVNRREQLLQSDPNYKPIDYNEQSEFDVKALEEDRSKHGNNKFSEGAKTERFYADQDSFWQRTEFQGKLLERDAKYAFLDENNPDTYNPDRAEELNGLYLDRIGFDPATKLVKRTDLDYDQFVISEVKRMQQWAAEENDNTTSGLAAQASTSGIRPSGSASKGLGRLKPGDISKMSDADFAKNEAEIDRQILAQLS